MMTLIRNASVAAVITGAKVAFIAAAMNAMPAHASTVTSVETLAVSAARQVAACAASVDSPTDLNLELCTGEPVSLSEDEDEQPTAAEASALLRFAFED